MKSYFSILYCMVFLIILIFGVINCSKKDTEPPEVWIVSPDDMDTIYGTIDIIADAEDNTGVKEWNLAFGSEKNCRFFICHIGSPYA